MRFAFQVCFALVSPMLASNALAEDPAPATPLPAQNQPAPAATRTPGPNGDFLYRATLAPDAALNYIQLTSWERAKYRYYARHMNETQRLEYLRRVRSEDREKYARDLGLPQQLENVPEPTRSQVMNGKIDLGMTPDQVLLSLGDPAGKMLGAGTLMGKSYKSWEKWSYQKSGGPFYVWFGNGVVVGFDPSSSPPADESLPSADPPK